MLTWTTGLLRQELLVLALLTAVLATALRWLRPVHQRGLRTTWTLLNLGAFAQLLALLLAAQQHSLPADLFRDTAHVLWVLASLHLGALLLFKVLLPAAKTPLPQIAHDLTVSGLPLGWGLLWLRLVGVDASQLFATSAIVTAVVAFAMQDTLGNVMGGVALQLDNSLRVGEWVQIDDLSGRVVDVRWRHTEIQTRNFETVVVPNSWLMKNRFRVLRKPPGAPLQWRRMLQFNIDHHATPTLVLRTLQQAVQDASIAHVALQPPPSAVLMDVCPGYNHYTLRYWLTDPQFDDLTDSAVRVHALAALAREGIHLGMPLAKRILTHKDEQSRSAHAQRDLARRTKAIRHIALFANLPEAEQQVLATHLVFAPFAAGSAITRQGAVAHWLYLILHGEAEVVVDSPQGRTSVARLHDGEFFGEMGLLTGEPRSATVLAATDVECYRLDKEGFALVLAARPELAEDISTLLATRRTEMANRLNQTATIVAPVRSNDLLARMRSFFAL